MFESDDFQDEMLLDELRSWSLAVQDGSRKGSENLARIARGQYPRREGPPKAVVQARALPRLLLLLLLLLPSSLETAMHYV